MGTAEIGPHEVEAPATLFRVARADQPLRFSHIAPAAVPLPKAGNRFDVPGGGVLYCATLAGGCYAETLARFRPSAAVRAAVEDEDPKFMICGGVPADWRDRRLEVELAVDEALPFLDVEHEETHEYLTTAVAREMAALSIPVIDVGVIRGPNRLATRAVSAWAFAAQDDDGNLRYSGIRYMSRLGDHECWAVFEGTTVRELARVPIMRSNLALQEVAAPWGLNVF